MTTTNENGDEIGVRVNDKGFLAFVGCDVQIKVTDEMPRRIGVISTIMNVCATNSNQANQIWFRLKAEFPEIFKELVIKDVTTGGGYIEFGYSMYQFKGQGQRLTPVVDLRTWVKLVSKLRSKKAASFQDFVADLVVRYLGGDEALQREVQGIREASTTANNPFVEPPMATPVYPQIIDPPTAETAADRLPAHHDAMGALKTLPCVSGSLFPYWNTELSIAVTGMSPKDLMAARGYKEGDTVVDAVTGKKRKPRGPDYYTNDEMVERNRADHAEAKLIRKGFPFMQSATLVLGTATSHRLDWEKIDAIKL
jgi:hypothetical protein